MQGGDPTSLCRTYFYCSRCSAQRGLSAPPSDIAEKADVVAEHASHSRGSHRDVCSELRPDEYIEGRRPRHAAQVLGHYCPFSSCQIVGRGQRMGDCGPCGAIVRDKKLRVGLVV